MRPASSATFQNIVSGTVLANILGITQPRVVQLTSEGMPKEAGQGYDLYKVIQWLMQRERSTRVDNFKKKKTSLVEAQRAKLLIETDILRGRLMQFDEVQSLFNELAATLATQLDGVASRIADEVTGNTNKAEVQKTLLREMRSIRRGIADQISAAIATPNLRGDTEATT